jgi:hypothetical protein
MRQSPEVPEGVVLIGNTSPGSSLWRPAASRSGGRRQADQEVNGEFLYTGGKQISRSVDWGRAGCREVGRLVEVAELCGKEANVSEVEHDLDHSPSSSPVCDGTVGCRMRREADGIPIGGLGDGERSTSAS